MSPPINTPGGSEVSEIVLPDGSTASEVIGPDGNVVFEAGADIPDSVVNQRFGHWSIGDVSATDGTRITSVSDKEVTHSYDTPSGDDGVVYRSNGPGGNPYAEWRTSTEALQSDYGQNLSPYSLIAVVRSANPPSSGDRGFGFTSSTDGFVNNRNRERSNDQQQLYADANTFISGAAGNSNWNIEVWIQDGGSSVIRRNGTQTGSGNPGTRGFDVVTMDADTGEADVAEWIQFDFNIDGQQVLTDAESYLSDKYGITI